MVADIQVTGSANIVSFTPYSSGDAPVELVNDFFFPIVYGQRKGLVFNGTTSLANFDYW